MVILVMLGLENKAHRKSPWPQYKSNPSTKISTYFRSGWALEPNAKPNSKLSHKKFINEADPISSKWNNFLTKTKYSKGQTMRKKI